MIRRIFFTTLAALVAVCPLFAEPPAIHTERTTGQVLPLPKGDDMFNFIIFGDRTGGPPDGVKVLAQAVSDTNALDPDLVMTVGDLVQGYNDGKKWMTQMEEYRGIMTKLKMPWFPVAGNHDIYWRGEGRPPTEHEAAYEKHFGPLWYWFEHKKCGFLVLFSDEGQPDNRVRNFDDPKQQQFSPVQMAWLKKSLAEMNGLKHVFVFMHHPRWAVDLYPATNWPAVHKELVAAGNVRGVFAGHIHRLRYDGNPDGIEYMALAATGASMPGHYPGLGYVHHFNVVTVRPDGMKVSVLPVGAVIDPRIYTPQRKNDMDSVRKMNPEVLSEALPVGADGLGAGQYEVRLTNPATRPVDITYVPEPSGEWIVVPDHGHAAVEAGASATLAFTCIRTRKGSADGVKAPVFALNVDYLEGGIRTPFPERKFPVPVKLKALPDEAFAAPAQNMALHLSGVKSGVRVDSTLYNLPDGAFTLETWLWPEAVQETAGVVAKTQSSDYGFLLDKNIPSFLNYVGDRYKAATGHEPLEYDRWSHLAGVYDGSTVRLYVNGKLVDSMTASGLREKNNLPLYLGADPDSDSSGSRPFKGWLDEIRLSRGVRYTGNFKPERRVESDADTILLYHCDRTFGRLLPDHSPSHAHGEILEGVEIAPAP